MFLEQVKKMRKIRIIFFYVHLLAFLVAFIRENFLIFNTILKFQFYTLLIFND
jgi:hypothetical protein